MMKVRRRPDSPHLISVPCLSLSLRLTLSSACRRASATALCAAITSSPKATASASCKASSSGDMGTFGTPRDTQGHGDGTQGCPGTPRGYSEDTALCAATTLSPKATASACCRASSSGDMGTLGCTQGHQGDTQGHGHGTQGTRGWHPGIPGVGMGTLGTLCGWHQGENGSAQGHRGQRGREVTVGEELSPPIPAEVTLGDTARSGPGEMSQPAEFPKFPKFPNPGIPVWASSSTCASSGSCSVSSGGGGTSDVPVSPSGAVGARRGRGCH